MDRHPTHRLHPGHIVAIVGAGAVVAGAFAPWIGSGSVRRDSFAMLRIADDLGVVHGWVRRTILLSWFAMPAACGVLVLLSLTRRRWPAALLAAGIGALGLVVWWAARRSRLPLAYGAAVNQVGVALLMAGALLSSRPRRKQDV